jgi:selenide,water dikinase
MRCLGCAAKVGGGTLSRVMHHLREEQPTLWQETVHHASVPTGVDTPDDAAVIDVPPGRLLVQTVDYMPAPVADPHLFGRIATLHAFSDLFAMGAQPHSALLATLLPFAAEAVVADTLYQLLSGAMLELRRMGALLVGGHSAEGAVLGLAVTANGFAGASTLLPKSGLRAGQTLILTKALGTGALFAAEMRLKAKAAWVDSALDSMLIPNLDAARILREHGATGCTDVTGFGVAGHLLEMLRPAALGAELRLDALPALPGVMDCLRSGIASSLHESNSEAAAAIVNGTTFAAHERWPLLFDPQTSGGLLAGVPAEQVSACVTALRRVGCSAASIIGEVVAPETAGAPLSLV